jgi:hypothetical protein
LSVEWYHRWIETGDPLILQRILDYKPDNRVATRARLDAIRRLPVNLGVAIRVISYLSLEPISASDPKSFNLSK